MSRQFIGSGADGHGMGRICTVSIRGIISTLRAIDNLKKAAIISQKIYGHASGEGPPRKMKSTRENVQVTLWQLSGIESCQNIHPDI